MENQRPVAGPVRATWSESQPARYRTRLAFALGLSLVFHAFIISLRFGAAGWGLPGLELPWAERRVQASNLTVRLADLPRPEKASEVRPPKVVRAVPPKAPLSLPRRATAAREREIRKTPQPEILAQSDPQQDTFNVPPPKPAEPEQQHAPDTAATEQAEEPPPAVKEEEPAVQKLAEEDAARRAIEREARRQEEARREADKAALRQAEETARQLAEEVARQRAEEAARERALSLQKEQEARKLEEARRVEDARKQEEARKREEARRIALEAEALRRAEEAARQQAAAAARQKELEAQRQAEEAAARTQELTERQRAEAQDAVQRERLAAELAPPRPAAGTIGGTTPSGAPPAPGALSGRDLAAKAIEQLRSPGAARMEPLRAPPLPGSADRSRRRSIFGVERDVGLRMYVESWRWKVERNGTLNYPPSAKTKARENPIVTVAIRSDGSLEEVFIHRSSGLRELDEAVRRIVQLYSPYSAFPPDLARQYDVIEIRRVWFFGDTLRILEEM